MTNRSPFSLRPRMEPWTITSGLSGSGNRRDTGPCFKSNTILPPQGIRCQTLTSISSSLPVFLFFFFLVLVMP